MVALPSDRGDLRGTDRWVAVTGASRGIGRAVAVSLAGAFDGVIGIARSGEALAGLGREVEGLGARFEAVVADLGGEAGVEAAVARCSTIAPDLHGLVNVAGLIIRSDPPTITPLDVEDTFALNVRAPLLLTQGLMGSLSAGEGGAVVNITSLAANTVTRASVTYQASKAALVQMTRALAVRLGPAIRVNAVGPGYVETDLNREWFADPANRQYVTGSTALGRAGQPEEVAGVVKFLLSGEAAYITGQHIVVDGGWRTP